MMITINIGTAVVALAGAWLLGFSMFAGLSGLAKRQSGRP
jgi:hypothetical protein